MCDISPLPIRKEDEAATPRQGPIGRAVRKLTPRKASLVNLFKGKGWNKAEEPMATYGAMEHELLSGTTPEASPDDS
ncbi:hypothetical protein K469DRAFT_717867 [Zopfia rhizophila CBS 207.26]|uniref:Uncharacterized protein n=1 Tax=Zopfia rhizophila CBS 207.26 TaxID=1314779 RepID=A0A6A6DMN2_9PEZI|nr:hypothetical protein K469DRAFT_717867 [Zopfia rhizophila CBS 207.26]